MKVSAVLFALACCWSGEAARIKVTLPGLELNQRNTIMEGAPLVPGMVAENYNVYQVQESWQFGNNYMVKQLHQSGDITDALKFTGSWKSKYFGHGSIHVSDPSTGNEIFKIRRSRHAWNPVEMVGRFNFRILPPGSKDNADTLFTVTKDYIGRGFGWVKEEWRIHIGNKKDQKLAYYCVGSWIGWSMKCYKSEKDYGQGRNGLTVRGPKDVRYLEKLEPVATLSKQLDAATLINGIGLPNTHYLTIRPKEDSALFVAFAAILDTAHDINDKGSINHDDRRRHH